MRVLTATEVDARAKELLGGEELVVVTDNGAPVGVLIPWRATDLPDAVRRVVFGGLAEAVRREREVAGVDEDEVLSDFAAWRRSN